MADLLLYHTPGSCSRVALDALEEVGTPYREIGVALMTGAQYKPDFLSINYKGKVPVLIEDGVAVTELPVILYRLAQANPAAGLLPTGADGAPSLDALSDLVWIAGALHPTVHKIFRPDATSQADAQGVKAAAIEQLTGHAKTISARLERGGWWYGDHWSISDTFIAWIFSLAAQFDFPIHEFPLLADHGKRVAGRDAFVRTLEVERQATARDELPMPPGFKL